jgi:aerobic carbon-monoxide dehydrogenase large subunit
MSNRFKGRREDFRFVTGAGRYTNDCNLERQAHAAFRRSERAHARIVSVDASAAREHAGVIAVFTARDVADISFITLPPIQPPPGRGGQKLLVPERPVLARDRVRFVGEEIAVVVAETTAIARDAADLIQIDYEDLPAAIGFEPALREGAPQLHDTIPGNVYFEFQYGDAAKPKRRSRARMERCA